MDARLVDEPVCEGEPLRRVMVAADDEHRQPALRQLHEEVVEQLHGLGGGHALVVHVARNQHAVRHLVADDMQNPGQDVLLVFQHGKLIGPLAQMQVRKMDQFHACSTAKGAGHSLRCVVL